MDKEGAPSSVPAILNTLVTMQLSLSSKINVSKSFAARVSYCPVPHAELSMAHHSGSSTHSPVCCRCSPRRCCHRAILILDGVPSAAIETNDAGAVEIPA